MAFLEISFTRPPVFSLTSATKGMDLKVSVNIWSVEHGDCGKAATLVGDWYANAELVDDIVDKLRGDVGADAESMRKK